MHSTSTPLNTSSNTSLSTPAQHRLAGLALSAVMTLGVLLGVDHLATSGAPAPQWAQSAPSVQPGV